MVAFSENEMMSDYTESVYFITTTISTVGYGDFKGFVDGTGDWALEEGYLCIVIFSGIMLFASVTK